MVGLHHAFSLLHGSLASTARWRRYVAGTRGTTCGRVVLFGSNHPGKKARLERKLRAAVEREGLEPIGPAVLAVYENPWTTLPFMRRNELHIKITNTDEKEA